MKILFVVRAKAVNAQISPFIQSQADSLKSSGLELQFFSVKGKGISSYFLSSLRLRKYLRNHATELIHAHYSLCGLTALLAFSGRPIVLSLMGSDVLGEYVRPGKISFKSRMVVLVTKLILPFMSYIIVKSENINKKTGRKKSISVIPNGVDLDHFQPEAMAGKAKELLGLDPEKKYILFLNNPDHGWKNYPLAVQAFKKVIIENAVLLTPYPVRQEHVVHYYNAADLLLMTSFMEGSSNIIKEAMACNCPIVSTDAGDVKWILGETPGCFIATYDPEDIAEKISLTVQFSKEKGRTTGRRRIIDLGLDTVTVAKKIIGIYEQVIHARNS